MIKQKCQKGICWVDFICTFYWKNIPFIPQFFDDFFLGDKLAIRWNTKHIQV